MNSGAMGSLSSAEALDAKLCILTMPLKDRKMRQCPLSKPIPMPILQNPRHEAFAQARARGARLEDAYEDAGYVQGNGHASRLAIKPEVAERIAEIKAARADEEEVSSAMVKTALIRMAKTGEALKTAAAIREARLTMMEAWNVQQLVEENRRADRLSKSDPLLIYANVKG